ncbi:MAG: AfsR/SARP family transcriptional regulator [Gemmatimonadales bacterium]
MLLLRTFGALELTSDTGEPIPGAAAQRKPLLILALAALVPGGVPRERLLRALWPGTERARARATLKQHLYALRRATGNPRLITGSPRLRIASDAVRVDALDFVEHVGQGRLREAAELLRGDLLEDVTPADDLLGELIAEIRAGYDAKVALVRHAIAAQQQNLALARSASSASFGVERELAAATRRFVRGMIALPSDRTEARHRTASLTCDLLEGLRVAERTGLPPAQTEPILCDALALWRRSELVQRMIMDPVGEPGAGETLDWLVNGGIRTADPIGAALEEFVLACGIAAQYRVRSAWELRETVAHLAAEPRSGTARVLLAGHFGSRHISAVGAAVQASGASLTVADAGAMDSASLWLGPAAERATLLHGDLFAEFSRLAESGPFDVILAGSALDQIVGRTATWLVEHLLGLLTPGGAVCLSGPAAGNPFGLWLRHIVSWNGAERDPDEVVLLTGTAGEACDLRWSTDPADEVWTVAVVRRPALLGRAAAIA